MMMPLADLHAEVEADRAALKSANRILVRSRPTPDDVERAHGTATQVVAVMADGTEVELTSVVSARWEHNAGGHPRLVVELLNVEIDIAAAANAVTGAA